MKKLGYTLAEILIAVAIVGVVAGLLLPLMGKSKPDANKIQFLKVYDSIVEVTNRISNDEELFPIKNDDDNINYAKYPLWNETKSKFGDIEYGGKNKYCKLLAFGLNGENVTCDAEVVAFGVNKTFTTNNGMDFWVSTERETEDIDGKTYAVYQSSVSFDIDGAGNGADCIYDSTTCKHPDRYTLFVTSDGKIVASDEMSQYYLMTRSNYQQNKEKSIEKEALVNLVDSDKKKLIERFSSDIEVDYNDPNVDWGEKFPNGKIKLGISCLISTQLHTVPKQNIASDLVVRVNFYRRSTKYLFLTADYSFEKGKSFTEAVPPQNIVFQDNEVSEKNPLGAYVMDDSIMIIESISPMEDEQYVYMPCYYGSDGNYTSTEDYVKPYLSQ